MSATTTQVHTPPNHESGPPGSDAPMVTPGDDRYERAVTAWNLLQSHRPEVVVLAEHPQDIASAVRYARRRGLGVGVIATGHGTGIPADGGVLISTSAMTSLSVDPASRTARLGAGVTWSQLHERAARYGLVGLQGSNSSLSVVGYSLGGGFGWLGRQHGFASQSVVELELVTASGEILTVTETEHPDLFWGVPGSAGNLGIVTSLVVRLVDVAVVYGGTVYYPAAQAKSVLAAYADWARDQPPEMMTAATLVSFPPLPGLPPEIVGKPLVGVRMCWSGRDLEPGIAAVAQLRSRLGVPLLDQTGLLPAAELDRISGGPRDPMPYLIDGALVDDLTPGLIDHLIGVYGVGSALAVIEVRQLGGALRVPADRLSPLGRGDERFMVEAVAPAFDPAQQAAAAAKLAELVDGLAAYGDGTTYVNFLTGADGAARMRRAFSAAEWDRLRDLKRRWDPDNVFRFNRNIPPSGC